MVYNKLVVNISVPWDPMGRFFRGFFQMISRVVNSPTPPLPPEKKNVAESRPKMVPSWTIPKRNESSSKHYFSGDMLVLGGVSGWLFDAGGWLFAVYIRITIIRLNMQPSKWKPS